MLERLSAERIFARRSALCEETTREMFLQFLSDASVLGSWRNFGGLETLHSYGVNVAETMRGTGYQHAQAALVNSLPPRHRQFLEKTRLSLTLGDYFFSHAGARPGVQIWTDKRPTICCGSATNFWTIRATSEKSSCIGIRRRHSQKSNLIVSILILALTYHPF